MIRPPKRRLLGLPVLVALLALLLAPVLADLASAQSPRRGTGLPLPRYVSLKSNDVNVRRGPGQEYDVVFTFVRAGLPVEITEEFDNWRKIRDSEGAEGWVFHSLLSGKRTALVAPWDKDGQFAAHAKADAAAPVVAYLKPRVLADVQQCAGGWCLLAGKDFEGWVAQDSLWGVYPDEAVED
jgi:SH3-like domain-containing protein